MNLPKQKLVKIASNIRDRLLTLKQSKQRQVQSTGTGLIEQMARLIRIRRKLPICGIRNRQAACDHTFAVMESFHGRRIGV